MGRGMEICGERGGGGGAVAVAGSRGVNAEAEKCVGGF